MKLLYCAHCGDIVRLFPERRTCRCGKSWGEYLEDGATTVQTYPGLSLGIANEDFAQALQVFHHNPRYFSPLLAMRCWINPLSETDVKFVMGEDIKADEEEENEADEEDEEENETADEE